MTNDKYVGMDVHAASTVAEVQNCSGKVIHRSMMETNAEQIKDFLRGISGTVHVTFEEGTHARWLYDTIKPVVAEVMVCNPRHNKLISSGNKSDKIDVHKLTDLLRMGGLKGIYHGDEATRGLKEATRSYRALARDCNRVMNRIKAIYRSTGIKCKGTAVFRPKLREDWVTKVVNTASGNRLGLLYEELDFLTKLRKEARGHMVKAVRRQEAYKILEQVPALGPIRIAQIIATVSSPFRFRTKRQFWPYCGLAVVTVSSSDYEVVGGKFQRSKKPIGTRGLNRNYNRDLKYVFKSAALHASTREPFKAYYDGLIANKMKAELARVTLARKIAAVTLAVWKKGEDFDAKKIAGK